MAMMQFQGTETFDAPVEVVFAKLTDLNFLKDGIPDLVSSEIKDDQTLACRVRPGVSFLKGSLDLVFRIVERSDDGTAKMAVQGKGIGASLELLTTLRVKPREEGQGSGVEWSSEITQLGGLLKAVSKGLIEGVAMKVSRQSWDEMKKRIDGGSSRALGDREEKE